MTDKPASTHSTPEQQAPLLSICIPTYNRANFLRVMLQALLPQAAKSGSDVEIWVLDNASTDETSAVLDQARDLGPFHVHRQSTNTGPLQNIIDGPTKFVSGKFTWILGDHNLLRPGGLATVLDKLKQQSNFQVFYVNFRVAIYPDQWPSAVDHGYDGPFTYLGNPELADEVVERWTDLIRPYSAACTQAYAHIVKTAVWRDYWADREIAEPYTSAITTYPHTITLLHSVGNQPAAVLKEPVLTIFNGAQSWNNPTIRLRVYLSGLPDLLEQIATFSLPPQRILQLWKNFFRPETRRVILDAYRRLGRCKTFWLLMTLAGHNWESWKMILFTLFPGFCPRLHARLNTAYYDLQNYRGWYLWNFRPARWLRSRCFLPSQMDKR